MSESNGSDLEWFVRADMSPYKGEYVVIIDKKVVAHGSEADVLLNDVRHRFPDRLPALAKVPSAELLVMKHGC